MRKLFIILILICFASPVIAAESRDSKMLQLGMVVQQMADLAEKMELLEYKKLKLTAEIRKLDSEKKTDEKDSTDNPDPASGR